MIFGVTHLAMMALIFWMVQNQRATSLLVTWSARASPEASTGESGIPYDLNAVSTVKWTL